MLIKYYFRDDTLLEIIIICTHIDTFTNVYTRNLNEYRIDPVASLCGLSDRWLNICLTSPVYHKKQKYIWSWKSIF